MTDQLISFETAKLAKEKGFNKPCNSYWCDPCQDNNIVLNTLLEPVKQDDMLLSKALAPTQSLLQKWLREEHNIHVYVTYRRFVAKPDSDDGFYFHIGKSIEFSLCDDWGGRYKTYEEALEVGLLEALKLIKDDKR